VANCDITGPSQQTRQGDARSIIERLIISLLAKAGRRLPVVASTGLDVRIRTIKRAAIRARINIPADIWISRMPIFWGSMLGIAASKKNPMHHIATIRTASSQCSVTSSG
jgi:hypothetical protein